VTFCGTVCEPVSLVEEEEEEEEEEDFA